MVCQEEQVTGELDFKPKTFITEEDFQNPSGCNLSNVLYAKSYVVHGQGFAIVCAVGSRTQIGMSINGIYS